MPESITAIQEAIIKEFVFLAEDMELTLHHLIDHGKALPPLSPSEQQDQYLVDGCQSKVWILSSYAADRVHYRAQSNAVITQGLVSLLIRTLSGQNTTDILRAELFFPSRIQMSRFIGTQRSIGFTRMWTEMKKHALSYISKVQER